jgi:hypothetical protein
MGNAHSSWERQQIRNIDPDRLWAATEAALEGAADVAAFTGGPIPYPADLVGSAMQPECMRGFMKWEITAACEFLMRMGFLEWSDGEAHGV